MLFRSPGDRSSRRRRTRSARRPGQLPPGRSAWAQGQSGAGWGRGRGRRTESSSRGEGRAAAQRPAIRAWMRQERKREKPGTLQTEAPEGLGSAPAGRPVTETRRTRRHHGRVRRALREGARNVWHGRHAEGRKALTGSDAQSPPEGPETVASTRTEACGAHPGAAVGSAQACSQPPLT